MATLNITFGGYSADYPYELDAQVRDADVRRVAVESIRSGTIPGLRVSDLGDRAFDQHVIDRFGAGKGARIYLRPKVPFGLGHMANASRAGLAGLFPSLRKEIVMTVVAFCGVGALGSHAVMLCRNLDVTLRLVDFDRVESKNLASQAYVKPSIGKNKAEALKLQLSNFYGVRAESFGVRVVENNVASLLGTADLVIDCFDNAAGRVVLSDFARSANKPLLHAGISADGTVGLVRWDASFVPDAEDVEGQATCEDGRHLPLVGQISATIARATQDFVATGARRDWLITLSGVVQTGE